MKRRDFATLALPSLIVMFALLVVPLVLTLVWSFQNVSYGTPGQWVGLENYTSTLTSPRFLRAAAFTFGLTAVATVLKLVIGYGLALLLNAIRRGRSVLLGLLFITYVVPAVVGAVVLSWMFNNSFGGVVNWLLSGVGIHVDWLTSTWPARFLILLQVVWQEVAFALIVLLAGLQAVPAEQIEAAQIDGASWWQRQRYVIIPSLSRLISFIILISVMDGLRVFDAIRVITPAAQSTGTESIMVYIYEVALGQTQQLGLGSAVSVLTVIATIIVLLPFIRQTFEDVRNR